MTLCVSTESSFKRSVILGRSRQKMTEDGTNHYNVDKVRKYGMCYE